MIQITPRDRAGHGPLEEIDNEIVPAIGLNLGPDRCAQHLPRHDETQPTGDRVGEVMRNTVNFARFHAAIVTNGQRQINTDHVARPCPYSA